MMKALVVLGSNYAEGKGKFIHELARKHGATTVIRFNGCLTSDIAISPNGSGAHCRLTQFGASSFIGTRTHLLGQTVFSPLDAMRDKAWMKEVFGFVPEPLTVSPNIPVLTPWDIALTNYQLEGATDPIGLALDGRDETYLRMNTEGAPRLLAWELGDPLKTFTFASDIRHWYRARLKEEAAKGSFSGLSEEDLEDMKNSVECPSLLTTTLYQYCAAINQFPVVRLPLAIRSTEVVILQGTLPVDRAEEEMNLVREICTQENIEIMEVFTGSNANV